MLFFSLCSTDVPLGLDALVHTWPHVLLYAFPSLALIHLTLTRVREHSGSALASNALAGGDLLVDVCLSVAALAMLGPAHTSSRVFVSPPPGAPLYGLCP